MNKFANILMTLWMLHLIFNQTECDSQSRVLSRKRRHLIFPKGSNFIVMLTQTRTLPFAKTPPWFTRLLPIWQGLIEFELKFPLPPEILKEKHEKEYRKPSEQQPYWHGHWHAKPGAHGKWWAKRPHWRRRWSNKNPHKWGGDRHQHDRRRIHRAVAHLLDANGMDGSACVRRAQCETVSSSSTPSEEQSIVEHILRLIFIPPHGNVSEGMVECEFVREECPFSLLQAADYTLF